MQNIGYGVAAISAIGAGLVHLASRGKKQ